MPEPSRHPEPTAATRQVVGGAIQNLMVARLGRSFVPLALLFLAGVVQSLTGDAARVEGFVIALGAIATSAAMLAYGLRVVQRAFGRGHRFWMTAAMAGSLVPLAYSLYVIGWSGLRLLFAGSGVAGVGAAILHVGAGVWVLRSWMKVVEIERLARVMSMNLDGEEGPA